MHKGKLKINSCIYCKIIELITCSGVILIDKGNLSKHVNDISVSIVTDPRNQNIRNCIISVKPENNLFQNIIIIMSLIITLTP